MELVKGYDIIIDGTDNFPARYLSNDVCVLTKKPNVYGSIFRFEGQSTVFAPHLDGPCYRCMFPEPATTWHGSKLCGGWRPGGSTWDHRYDAGY